MDNNSLNLLWGEVREGHKMRNLGGYCRHPASFGRGRLDCVGRELCKCEVLGEGEGEGAKAGEDSWLVYRRSRAESKQRSNE